MKIKLLFRKITLLLLLFFVSILVVSCGAGSYVINSKAAESYYKKADLLKLDSIKIVKIIDNRSNKDSVLGTAHTGMFNKSVKCILNESVDKFVMSSFNSLISKNPDSKSFTPITIYIDTLKAGDVSQAFSEYAYCRYFFRFSYPYSNNDFKEISISDKIMVSNQLDATDEIPGAVFKAMIKASEDFISYYKSNLPKIDNFSSISSKNQIESPKIIKDTLKKKEDNKTPRKGFGLSYLKGGLIKSGFQGGYYEFFHKDSTHFEFGYGITLNYYNIKEHDNIRSASFIHVGLPLIGRFYVNNEPTGLYGALSLKINGGTESLSNGSTKKSNFFFGAAVEESLGIQIGKTLSLQAGIYQLGYIGSQILPSDIGFTGTIILGF